MTTRTCPCALAVPLDYSRIAPLQAEVVWLLIAQMGEYLTLHVDGRAYRVSRHCLALHGVSAKKIDSYGFTEIDPHTAMLS